MTFKDPSAPLSGIEFKPGLDYALRKSLWTSREPDGRSVSVGMARPEQRVASQLHELWEFDTTGGCAAAKQVSTTTIDKTERCWFGQRRENERSG